MGDKRNFAALDWVIGEISDTLNDARQALESYVEDPRDSTRMRFCLTHIHQVYGSLQMVEFHGACLLAEEMEQAAQAIISNEVSNASEAHEVLMRAMLQLPTYLEHIKISKEDHPGVVLPLLNDLRAVRKKSFLSETNLFSPNLDAAKPEPQPLHKVTQDPVKLAEFMKKLREMYQFAAASVLRGISIDENLGFLDKVLTRLELITRGTNTHATWKISAALIDALIRDELELSVAVRGLLRYLARELRLLSEKAPKSFDRASPESLLKNLLYYVAKAEAGSERVAHIREAYDLDHAELGGSADSAGESSNMTAPDPDAVRSVIVALQEELNSVKHVLDLLVKGQGNVKNLEEMLPAIKRVGDTLAVLGIGDLRKKIVEQIELVNSMVDKNELNDAELLEVANRVIDVEHKLEAISKVVGKSNDLSDINEREIEIDQAKAAVLVECRNGLERAKESIIEYISSKWDTVHLKSIDGNLRDIRGGLEMIPLPRPAAIVVACNRFILEELLTCDAQPSWEKLDALADAMASVEFYLERLASDIDVDADALLDIAEQSVTSLGYPPSEAMLADNHVPSNDSSVEDASDSAGSSGDDAAFMEDGFDFASAPDSISESSEQSIDPLNQSEDEVAESDIHESVNLLDSGQASESEATQDLTQTDNADSGLLNTIDETVSPSLSLDSVAVDDAIEEDEESDIDDEIIEIFVEEAGEVLETLQEYVPLWRENKDDDEPLVVIRRAFHTLKGSGRMVEAHDVGELGWSVENMLNRLIDKTIPFSVAQPELISRVMAFTPELISAFERKKKNPNKPYTEALIAIAEAITDGESNIGFEQADALAKGVNTAPTLQPAAETIDTEPPAQEPELIEQVEPAALPLSSFAEKAMDLDADSVAVSTPEPSDSVDEEEDRVLTEIFTSEARTHLATMAEFNCAMRAAAPIFTPPTDSLQRALHTLKGSAKMADKMPFAHMTEPLENFAKELITYQVAIDEDVLQLLTDGTEYMHEAIDRLERIGDDQIPKLDQFCARLDELSERLVGPLIRLHEQEIEGQNQVDPRLLSIFMAEEMTLLLDAEFWVDKWRTCQGEFEKISDLIAELQTLGEGANKASLADMELLSGLLENCHVKLKDQQVEISDRYCDVAIDGHNSLLDMVDAVAAGQHVVPPPEDLLQALEVICGQAVLAEIDQDGAAADETLNAQSDDASYLDAQDSASFDHPIEGFQELAASDLTASDLTASDLAATDLETSDLAKPDEESTYASELEEPLSFGDIEVTVGSENQTSENLLDAQQDISEVMSEDDISEVIELDISSDENSIETSVDEGEPSESNEVHAADALYDHVMSQQPNTDNALDSVSDENTELMSELLDISEPELDEPRLGEPKLGEPKPGELEPSAIDTLDIEDTAVVSEVDAESGADTLHRLNQEDFDPNETPKQADDVALEFDVVDLNSPDYDEDIFEVFMEEADELTEELDEAIHQWEADWSNIEPADVLKRALHTLKGGARLSNLEKLGDLTHDYETYVIATRSEDVDDQFFKNLHAYQDKVLRSVKALHEPASLGDQASSQDKPGVSQSIEPATSSNASPNPASNVVPIAGGSVAPETTDIAVAPGFVGGQPAQVKPAAKRSGPQEVVKVPADLLEELVNLAGETSISRGRLEQQVTDFSFSLDEVDNTILRLQEQIRRLDIETEAQILFRQEQIAESDTNFDPLEMDRYSQLQQLSRSLIESASDLADLRDTLREKVRDTETLLLQQSRVNSNLQEGLMRSRMVPFSRMVPRLRRIVRQVATELGKSVSFELDNIEGELDRSVLERMVAPLEHMLRNAVDHGIEMPEERTVSGKPDSGRIVLTLGREGGEVILRLSDDGRGINLDRVREKAIERNLMTADAELSDLDVMQFILHAGFSTAENVTQISGRGVGMDVVNAEIKQLGGSVMINSEWGKGTQFIVRLPFTVSVNRALMVSIGHDNYAVPLNNIEGIVRVSPFELEHYYQDPDARFEYAGESYQVRYLGGVVSEARPKLDSQSLPLPVLLVRSAEHTMALQVDHLLGSREIVVKSLGQQFSSVLGLSGATLMGDGSVVVILDPHALVRKEIALARPMMMLDDVDSANDSTVNDIQTIMVVDDSVTVRKVTTRFLERQGYNVITAKDGVDALQVLQDVTPDLMLLDIEMPRMDGFEVAKNVKTTSRWKQIPIIMITSRTGDKHREHAFSLGVNNYLGKPYQEEVLLESITALIGESN